MLMEPMLAFAVPVVFFAAVLDSGFLVPVLSNAPRAEIFQPTIFSSSLELCDSIYVIACVGLDLLNRCVEWIKVLCGLRKEIMRSNSNEIASKM